MNISAEKLAGVLGVLLKRNCLSNEILEFLKYRLKNEISNRNKVYNAFNLMLQDGMTYYTNECYRNVIKCEVYVFANMLEIIHLWGNEWYEINVTLGNYIKYNDNLIMNLKKTDLRNAKLKGANLEGADISKADLKGVDLTGANLREASLRGVYLTKAILKEVNLERADIRDAIFSEEQVHYLENKYDLNGAKVYLSKEAEIVKFETYCKRKREVRRF